MIDNHAGIPKDSEKIFLNYCLNITWESYTFIECQQFSIH